MLAVGLPGGWRASRGGAPVDQIARLKTISF